MKKILLLLSFSVVLLSSCSSDDSSSSESQPLLLKTMTEGDVLFGQTVTNYTYNGNKLVEIFKDGDDDYADVYTYTGDLITKIEKFAVYDAGTPSEDRQLLSTDQFAYNANNQLVQFTTTSQDFDGERVTTYVYNSDNTVSFAQNANVPGEPTESLKTGTITVQNGEIVRLQVVKEFDSYTDNYTYDTKNSIFKNVTGYDKIIFTHIIGKQGSLTWVDSIVGGISHNFLNNSGEFQYTYNSDNYPLTANQSLSGTVLHSFAFEYY